MDSVSDSPAGQTGGVTMLPVVPRQPGVQVCQTGVEGTGPCVRIGDAGHGS